jgi:hypothetical protein
MQAVQQLIDSLGAVVVSNDSEARHDRLPANCTSSSMQLSTLTESPTVND